MRIQRPIRTVAWAMLAAGLALPAAPVPSGAAVIETIEAVVNAEPITSGELDRFIERIGDDARIPADELRNRRLTELIERTLLLQTARERSITADDAEVDLEVKRGVETITQRLGGREALERHLASIGGTMDDLRAELAEQSRRDILHSKMLSYVTGSISVNEQDIQEFRTKRPDQFARSDTVQIWQILLDLPADADEETVSQKEQLAREIVLQARTGIRSFAELARDFTVGPARDQGGYMGDVSRGVMLSAYDPAFEMRPGEISEPTRISVDGRDYLLIYMVGQRLLPRDYLLQERRAKAYDEHMAELKANSHIRIKTSGVATRGRGGPVDEEIETR